MTGTRAWLRWVVPGVLVATGVLIIIVGFAYDVVYAGIPYQDPTPEMTARYNYHSRVAGQIRLTGLATATVGVVVLGVTALARGRT
jgi:hypothetical protein